MVNFRVGLGFKAFSPWRNRHHGFIPFNYFSAVNQDYMIRAGAEDVIMGNNALLKCSIPSFVADLVSVISWLDTDGNVYIPNPLNYGNLGFWLPVPLWQLHHGYKTCLNNNAFCPPIFLQL